MKKKILIVDDDKEIRRLVEIYLKNEGYETLMASDGVEALDILKREAVDLMILDVMMPRMDGIDACIKAREQYSMPIIMLSAKSEDMDKILGLSSGADDYLPKPFNPLELVARVKSQLRRLAMMSPGNSKDETVIAIHDMEIHIDSHEVIVSGEKVKLTPTEFDILRYLAENEGIVLTIEKIYEHVWKEEFFESKNTVMVHIRKLREKVEKDPRNPVYIQTVWGVGYKMEG